MRSRKLTRARGRELTLQRIDYPPRDGIDSELAYGGSIFDSVVSWVLHVDGEPSLILFVDKMEDRFLKLYQLSPYYKHRWRLSDKINGCWVYFKTLREAETHVLKVALANPFEWDE